MCWDRENWLAAQAPTHCLNQHGQWRRRSRCSCATRLVPNSNREIPVDGDGRLRSMQRRSSSPPRSWRRCMAFEAAADAGSSFLTDLRDGWSEFTAHRWLWAIVAQFSLVLLGFFGAFLVLGPVVAERDLSGASSWAAILGGQSAGLLVGGLVALRWRPPRPLLVGTIAVFGNALPIAALAMGLPLVVIIAAAVIDGVGMELFVVYWYTALHEHVAPEALARVSSYDALGSIGISPIGLLAAGPLSELIGVNATLWMGVILVVVPTAVVLFVPEVRNLRSRAALVELAT